MKERRKTTREETTSPCAGCGWPLSHRHHILDIAHYGENDETVLVCPNCHWLAHICVSALIKRSKPAFKLWDHLLRKLGDNHPQITWAKELMRQTLHAKIHQGVGRHLQESDHDRYNYET